MQRILIRMFRQTLDQRQPERPLVNNDQLRILAKHPDPGTAKWAVDLLTRRMKKYSAAANLNRGNMR